MSEHYHKPECSEEECYCGLQAEQPPEDPSNYVVPNVAKALHGYQLISQDIVGLNPLFLVIEPKDLDINAEKGTEFKIKSLSPGRHDVIVTCHSYVFEIKEARRKIGITSQWFHVFGKNETKSFEIVVKDLKDESMGNFVNSPWQFASGFIEITHYKSLISGSSTKPKILDNDEEWGIEGSKLLIRTACTRYNYKGYWKGMLKAEFETEQVSKRKQRFAEIRQESLEKKEREEIEMRVTATKMITTEQRQSDETKYEILRKERENERKKKEKEEEEDRKKNPEKYQVKKEKKFNIKKLFNRKK